MNSRYMETMQERDDFLDPAAQKATEIDNLNVNERIEAVKTQAKEAQRAQTLNLENPEQVSWDQLANDGVDISEGVPVQYLSAAHPQRYVFGRDAAQGFSPTVQLDRTASPQATALDAEADALGVMTQEEFEGKSFFDQVNDPRYKQAWDIAFGRIPNSEELPMLVGALPWLSEGVRMGVADAAQNVTALVAPYIHTPDEGTLFKWGLTADDWDSKSIEDKRAVYRLQTFDALKFLREDTRTERGSREVLQTLGRFGAPMLASRGGFKAAGMGEILSDLAAGATVASLVSQKGEGTVANVMVDLGMLDSSGVVAEYLATDAEDTTLEAMAKQAVVDSALSLGLGTAFRGAKALTQTQAAEAFFDFLKSRKGSPAAQLAMDEVKSRTALSRLVERGQLKAGVKVVDEEIEQHYSNFVARDIMDGKVLKHQFLADSEKYFEPEQAEKIWDSATKRAEEVSKSLGLEALAAGPKQVGGAGATPGKTLNFEFKDGTFRLSSEGAVAAKIEPPKLSPQDEAAKFAREFQDFSTTFKITDQDLIGLHHETILKAEALARRGKIKMSPSTKKVSDLKFATEAELAKAKRANEAKIRQKGFKDVKKSEGT